MANQSTAERVLRVLAEQTGFRAEDIKDDHHLQFDLHCDSLDCVEIMMALEEEFGIRLIDQEFEQLTTVQQVIDHIAGVCTAPTAAA